MPLNIHQLIGWNAAYQILKLHEDDNQQSFDTFVTTFAALCMENPEILKTIQNAIQKAQNLYENMEQSEGDVA